LNLSKAAKTSLSSSS